MQLGTIQRADLAVAIITPPAIIAAVMNEKLTMLLLTAAAVAAIRAVFIRSVLVALRAGQAPQHRHLAAVHDLAEHREARETTRSELADR